ncbi:MAG TPA: DUF72 domain-containing protein [Anaerolineaceae bacterium]|nr:MAG: Uncharacterized protein XD89_0087 [Anaerolineae bacterium 49_20]HAE85951.1 DUF72 domain-containing protein [Anaerolineaceae bacterium]
MAEQIRIGTSGWVYQHWQGLFYPADLPQKQWFAYYARYFDTVEVNSTFYHLQNASVFEHWGQQAPAGFLYAVKASRYITHIKYLKECKDPLETFLNRASLLRHALGPVLFQLPPSFSLDLSRLESFLALLPEGFSYAMEFRNPTWLREEVYTLLERFGVALCIHELPPLHVPLRITANFVYLRFHGDVDHAGDYPPETLTLWAERIQTWQRQGLAVYAYFNNDAGGMAVRNALTLKQLLGQGS